jgi:hypothetical protein
MTAAGGKRAVTIIGAGFGGDYRRQTRFFDPVHYQTDVPALEMARS